MTLAVAAEVNKQEEDLGIVVGTYGAGQFMVATKIKGMVAASIRWSFSLHDSWSQQLSYDHNGS